MGQTHAEARFSRIISTRVIQYCSISAAFAVVRNGATVRPPRFPFLTISPTHCTCTATRPRIPLALQVFKEFFELIFTFLIKPNQASRMMSRVETFGEEIGVNPTALQGLIRSWMTFLRTAQKNNSTPKAVLDEVKSIGLAEDKAKYVAKLYKKNVVALSRAVVGRTLQVNHLTDMEWRFGVVSGSSELRKAGSTFLQMKMTVNNGAESEDVWTELTLPQFFEFMKEMHKAKASLDLLS
jgi:hypothetical protein